MTAIQIRGLHKSFGRLEIVRDLSLTVGEGQVYGLVGPNGSGKTTTLSCALGLLRPDRGSCSILGVPSHRLHETAGAVGVVFDTPTLVESLSVRGNLAYGQLTLGHTGGRTIDEVLEAVGLREFARRSAAKLSLGQKRRLSIARALLGSPRLLVLDEPLSGLDTVGVRKMLNLFARLAEEGLTLLLSSHRLHEMERIVTHVGILLAGRVVREGGLDEIIGIDRGAYRLVVSPGELAIAVLRDLKLEVERCSHASDSGATDLRVFLDGVASADVNRRLIEAGCEVSTLTPEARTLQEVFESLLDDEDAGQEQAVANSDQVRRAVP